MKATDVETTLVFEDTSVPDSLGGLLDDVRLVEVVAGQCGQEGAGQYTTAGSTAALHLQHTATLLADGRVLATGGFGHHLGAVLARHAVLDGHGQHPHHPPPPHRHAADRVLVASGVVDGGDECLGSNFMGFLRRGPKWSKERTPEAQAAGEGHMANIKRLGACGKLLIAGPFKHPADAPDQGPLAGIFLFDVATQEEAEALMRTDPAIIAGRFTMEVLPWYGPAGLTYDGHVPVAPGTPCAP